ncbi:hypothetical protein RvY_12634-2 [Ramazzottius varieornatus]|uniref:AMOP domain-containing protein n=1 Tax=Ramazzottius varieornatus TaxID=947166 RepID=A0A1D1VK82_RAMVA|nr:hypothetical protein RvY_12634-2 [Ramazzottius varieornatus]
MAILETSRACILVLILSCWTEVGAYYRNYICYALWCKFMFPKKKPTFGIYPYYDYCNVRNLAPTYKEFYCYDKYYPSDSYDTFVTGISKDQPSSPGHMMKCCKLPYGYHLDYSRCEYKYNHDKFGEMYDEHNMWVTKCDRDFVLTGIGRAINPWRGIADYDYVWAQCCPLFYDPAYVSLFAGPVAASSKVTSANSTATAAHRPKG